MKLKYVILYVDNVRDSLAHFEAAFGCKTRFIHEAEDYGESDTGETVLAFSTLDLIRSLGKSAVSADASAPTFELAFTTTNVQEAVDRAIANGATLVSAPQQQPWGQTTAYVNDVNGFLIEICTPIDLKT